MNSVIKDILKRKVNIEDKRNALNSIEKDIEIAKKILSGEMIYCENCDDYFLARSFFQDTETKKESICTYSYPRTAALRWFLISQEGPLSRTSYFTFISLPLRRIASIIWSTHSAHFSWL